MESAELAGIRALLKVAMDGASAAPTQDADGRGYVSLPTNADEAELMAKMGLMWLGQHAPDRLAADAAPVAELVEALTDEQRLDIVRASLAEIYGIRPSDVWDGDGAEAITPTNALDLFRAIERAALSRAPGAGMPNVRANREPT